MNETWGPPIKIYTGGEYGKLSPQYSGGKRRSDSEPDCGTPTKKRMLKKEHKKFTSPASSEVNWVRAGTLADVEQRHPEDPTPTSTTRKLVLLPPKPFEPDGRRCARCRREQDRGAMYVCLACGRKAFCGRECQQKLATTWCSLACEGENPRHFARSNNVSPESDESSRSLLKAEVMSNLGARNNDGVHDEDVDMEGMGFMSPEEIEEQRKAMKIFKQKKEIHALERQLQAYSETYFITAYRIVGNGRSLSYHVCRRGPKNTSRSWVPAINMNGKEWTQKMQQF